VLQNGQQDGKLCLNTMPSRFGQINTPTKKKEEEEEEGVALPTAQGTDGHLPCADNAASYRVSRRGVSSRRNL
jgi:hypothetical protein